MKIMANSLLCLISIVSISLIGCKKQENATNNGGNSTTPSPNFIRLNNGSDYFYKAEANYSSFDSENYYSISDHSIHFKNPTSNDGNCYNYGGVLSFTDTSASQINRIAGEGSGSGCVSFECLNASISCTGGSITPSCNLTITKFDHVIGGTLAGRFNAASAECNGFANGNCTCYNSRSIIGEFQVKIVQ